MRKQCRRAALSSHLQLLFSSIQPLIYPSLSLSLSGLRNYSPLCCLSACTEILRTRRLISYIASIPFPTTTPSSFLPFFPSALRGQSATASSYKVVI